MMSSGPGRRRLCFMISLVVFLVGGLAIGRIALNILLFRAAGHGQVERAELLLRLGANVNAREFEGETPLMNAAFEGHTEMMSLLIRKGADINAISDNRETALARAVLGGDIAAVRFLLDQGASIDTDGSGTPLTYASFGNLDIVKLLLDRGANVNARDRCGATPLVYAIMNDAPIEIVHTLISAGAHVNVKNCQGKSALQVAVDRNHTDIVQSLRRAGAIE